MAANPNHATNSGIEAQRQAFHGYLKDLGVLDLLAEPLMALRDSPNRPPDALRFIRDHFFSSFAARMTEENEDLAKVCESLEMENASLVERIAVKEASNSSGSKLS